VGLAVGDSRQELVELVAAEAPVEWSGDLAAVVAEGQQPFAEGVQ
jgi:hypothetical protein